MDKQYLINSITSPIWETYEFPGKQDFLLKVDDFAKANKDLSYSEFLSKLDSEFPELKAFNEAYERKKLGKISSNINIIKTILIIELIASVIGVIYFFGIN